MVKYFAYGSNMNMKDVVAWCEKHHIPPVKFARWQIAQLQDHSLSFHAFSITRKCGVANIVVDPGSFVEGVLFELDGKDMDMIRRKVGSPGLYSEMHVSVKLKNGSVVDNVITFKVPKVFEDGKSRPSRDYLNTILEAAHTFSLDEEYIKKLEQTPCMDPPVKNPAPL